MTLLKEKNNNFTEINLSHLLCNCEEFLRANRLLKLSQEILGAGHMHINEAIPIGNRVKEFLSRDCEQK